MRLIGILDNQKHAERFAACMTIKSITTHLEQEGAQWEVWIKDEDQVANAVEEFDRFKQDPDAAQYSKVVDEASAIIRQEQKQKLEAQKNLVQVQQRWQGNKKNTSIPLSITLIVISVVVAFLTNSLDQQKTDHTGFVFRALAFTSMTDNQAEQILGDRLRRPNDPALRTGSLKRFEYWRLVTPIFIHFGILHLVFNCYWVFFFGRQIEGRYGSPWLLLLVIATAIPSNLVPMVVPLDWQGTPISFLDGYWITLAGGLSGVIYGMFGYVWMKMTFDRNCGFFMTPFTIMILVGWLFFCMFFGNEILGEGSRVGNWAHGVGLIAGLIIGYFPKLMSDLRGKPSTG